MRTRFRVMSRKAARKHSQRKHIKDCVIISIYDTFDKKNEFADNPHIKDVLYMSFDDVSSMDANCMTHKQAHEILSFAKKWAGKVDLLIVHCRAGKSRSSAICAAIMRILGYDDREIFINPRYFPNMHCYKLMLKAHYGRYCVRDIRRRARMNLCAWYIHRKSLNKFEGHS